MRVHTVFQTISGQPCIFSLYTKFIPRNFVIFKINFFLQIGIFSEKKIFQCKQLLRNFVEKGRYQDKLAFSVMNEIHPWNFVIFQNCNFSANLEFFQRKKSFNATNQTLRNFVEKGLCQVNHAYRRQPFEFKEENFRPKFFLVIRKILLYCWKPYRVVCPNFGHPALTSPFWINALCRLINHHSEAEIISKLTVLSQLLHFFLFCKWRSFGRVSEVRAHYPSWHTLVNLIPYLGNKYTNILSVKLNMSNTRVVFSNLGHPALTSSSKK